MGYDFYMKKLFFIALIFLFVLFCVSFLHSKTDSSVRIKFSAWGSQSEVEYLLPLIADFEKNNPDIKIEFLHIPQNYFQKLHLLFASKLAPDVVFINNQYLPKYVEAGLLLDLSDIFDSSDYFEKAIQNMTINGKIYAIPRDVSNFVVFYNKDLFDKYNIKYPSANWGFDEYIEISEKFKQNGVWATSFDTNLIFLLPYLFSNGGGFLDNDADDYVIDDKNTIDTLNFYSNLAKNGYAPKKSESASLTMAQLFLQQKIAMHVCGRWLVPKYRAEANFSWDIVQFPKGNKGSVTSIDASGYAISSQTLNKDEAIRFVQYISSKTSLEKLVQSGLIVPARKDVAYSKMFLDPSLKPQNSKIFVDIIEQGKVTPVNRNYQKIMDVLQVVLEPVFLGKLKAQDVVSDELLIELRRYVY